MLYSDPEYRTNISCTFSPSSLEARTITALDKMITTISNTTNKIIKKSKGLRARNLAEIDKQEGKEMYKLCVEVARLTHE